MNIISSLSIREFLSFFLFFFLLSRNNCNVKCILVTSLSLKGIRSFIYVALTPSRPIHSTLVYLSLFSRVLFSSPEHRFSVPVGVFIFFANYVHPVFRFIFFQISIFFIRIILCVYLFTVTFTYISISAFFFIYSHRDNHLYL